MATITRVTVIRHPKEKLSKCSLSPLQGRDDVEFLRAGKGFQFDASGYTVLEMSAPTLSLEDAGRPILLLDSTWRLLPKIRSCVRGGGVPRSLPQVETAYPRVSKIASDPLGGLASAEALYLAKLLLGERDDSILERYHWRDRFLKSLSVAGIL